MVKAERLLCAKSGAYLVFKNWFAERTEETEITFTAI